MLAKCSDDCRQTEKEKFSLSLELKKCEHCLQIEKSTVSNLEGIQQKLLNQISECDEKILALKEELKLSKIAQDKAQKKLNELSEKLENQFKLHEAALCDIETYFNLFREAKIYVEKQLDRVNSINQLIGQLSQAVEDKSSNLKLLLETAGKIATEKHSLSAILETQKKEIVSLKQQCKEQEESIKGRDSALAAKVKECESIQSKLNLVTSSYDSLSTRLGVKNEKLQSLRSSMKHLEMENQKAEQHVLAVKNELKSAKQEIADLCREKAVLTQRLRPYEKTKQTLNVIQEELMHEKLKGKALQLESQVPWNIHRWRLLEGTDPERHELLKKHHVLQKRLIRKTIEAQEKEVQLAQKEKAMEELKSLAQKQTPCETCDCITEYRWQLRDRTDKIKVLTAQVNMYESLVFEYRSQIANLKERLHTYKQKDSFHKTTDKRLKDMECTLSD